MANEMKITVPDIGDVKNVEVIELLVQPGDVVQKDQDLITLESDKASMGIPSPVAGKVQELVVKLGDKVSAGDIILTISPIAAEQPLAEPKHTVATNFTEAGKTPTAPESPRAEPQATSLYAGPGVYRMAREFGINLDQITGSGRKGRITKEDLQLHIKQHLNGQTPSLPSEISNIDFAKYGPVEVKPLNKIKRLTGVSMHRAWVSIPHVTQFDEADITDLEAFRRSEMEQTKDYKLTLLAFVIKAVSKALVLYPQFNTSLDTSHDNLIYKQYYNIGVAVETEQGLVVPVLRNVDQLSIGDIAKAIGELSAKARAQRLMPADMSGGCFTISSLGGIGGMAFTPIINGAEVAILGLSRASIKPIYEEDKFIPRLYLPLSLSYDHRVIDGAEAARFTRAIAELLEDIRRILL